MLSDTRILEAPAFGKSSGTEAKVQRGGLCTECGNYTVIKMDWGEFCTACDAVGGLSEKRPRKHVSYEKRPGLPISYEKRLRSTDGQWPT